MTVAVQVPPRYAGPVDKCPECRQEVSCFRDRGGRLRLDIHYEFESEKGEVHKKQHACSGSGRLSSTTEKCATCPALLPPEGERIGWTASQMPGSPVVWHCPACWEAKR